MSKTGCHKTYCNYRHLPAKKGTALVAAQPNAKSKAKADKDGAKDRSATPIPGKKKFAKAKADAKKANALVATMEEQRKKDE